MVSRSSWGDGAEADAMDPQAEGGAPRVCSLFAGVQLGISSSLKFPFCFSDQGNMQRNLGMGREASICFAFVLMLTRAPPFPILCS